MAKKPTGNDPYGESFEDVPGVISSKTGEPLTHKRAIRGGDGIGSPSADKVSKDRNHEKN